MTTTITISCSDERELMLHLSVLRTKLRQEIKKQKGVIEKKINFHDNNCYGKHTVTVNPE